MFIPCDKRPPGEIYASRGGSLVTSHSSYSLCYFVFFLVRSHATSALYATAIILFVRLSVRHTNELRQNY